MRETNIYDPYRFVQANCLLFRQLAAFICLRSQPPRASRIRPARLKAFFTLLLEWSVGYDQRRPSLISAGSRPRSRVSTCSITLLLKLVIY